MVPINPVTAHEANANQLISDVSNVSGSAPRLSGELVRMMGITKRFGGVAVNKQLNFDLRSGEVHALLGENGAGKTTLMNVLYGLYKPDEGEIYVKGQKVNIHTPADAIACGIGMVHQTFRLIQTLTVVENVLLGLPSEGPLLDLKTACVKVRELAQKYQMNVDPMKLVWQLSAGQQQTVEILKALYRDIQILILDEPTSVLTPLETEGLFVSMEQLVKEGYGIVFISHKLPEVLRVSHRISILRDGYLIGTIDSSSANRENLASLMVGREVAFRLNKAEIKPGKALLQMENISADNDIGLPALENVSLSVHRGEILGIAGVAGNGQTELTEVLCGLRSAKNGRIFLKGTDIAHRSTREIIQSGVAFIPEKVRELAVLPNLSIEENTVLKVLDVSAFRRGIFVNETAVSEWADKLIKSFDIRARDRKVPAGQLSGGNLHKLVLAEELGRNPDLIIVENPTAGLDVGATEYVRRQLLAARGNGKAIILVSSDLDEILGLSDRIAVMYRGAISGVLNPDQATPAVIGPLMAGLTQTESTHISPIDVEKDEMEVSGSWGSHKVDFSPSKTAGVRGLRFDVRGLLKLLADKNPWQSLFSSLFAIVLAFAIVGIILLIMGFNPLIAYESMWKSSLGNRNGFAETLVRMSPLLFAGLGTVVAYRCGIGNLGADGQIYLGALGATLMGLAFPNLPAIVHLPLVILAGMLFGGAYAALPGLMKAFRGVNEILTTLMFNYLAVFLVSWIVSGPLRDSSSDHPMPQSPPLPASAILPNIISGTRAHAGIIIAILVAVLVYILLWKTVIGYRIRAVGENLNAARLGGINVQKNIVLAMILSGSLAGLGGVGEVAGLSHILTSTLSSNFGFTAIAVALFGGLNPGPVVFSAFFFAALTVGAQGLQRTMGIPSDIVQIIQGLVLVFVIGRRLIQKR